MNLWEKLGKGQGGLTVLFLKSACESIIVSKWKVSVNVSHFFIADPWYLRITCPNLQESPNTSKQTCWHRLSPKSHLLYSYTSPVHISLFSSAYFQLRLELHPPFMPISIMPSLFPQSHCTRGPSKSHGAASGDRSQVLGCPNPTSVRRQIAAMVLNSNMPTARASLSSPAWVKWIVGTYSDVPKTHMMPGKEDSEVKIMKTFCLWHDFLNLMFAWIFRCRATS